VKLNTVDARVRSFPAETLASKTWRPGCIGVAVSPTTIGLGINEEAAMRQAVMVGVVLPAALMLVSGCATKKWVTELVGKKEVEIDQKFTGVDKKMADESQLKSTEGTLTQTKERAESAYSKADDTNSRLTRLWSNRNVRNQVENYQVLFGFDKWDLNDNAQTTLVSIIKEMKENPNLTVDLQGYADPVGSYPYNVGLSQRRVESVRRFLVEKGIELPRIHLIGLGPIAEKGTPNAEKRKVTVKLLVTKED
jgi:outer membrane protein OmpA-like peptidoglycan-associated protein